MKLGTHMPDGQRRKGVDNEICSTKVKVIIYPTFHSLDIMRK
jgi:hypothetical protein